MTAELGHAPRVRKVIEEAEDYAEGFLHAHEAVKGPFPVELAHGIVGGWDGGETGGGYDVLACVVTFGGTVPEKEAAVES